MHGLAHFAGLTAPLFLLVFFGYALSSFAHWPRTATDALTRFVFTVAMPALLFRLMSDFSRLPRVDPRILVAFFGGCLVVYAAGRVLGARVFHLDGVGRSVFAMGGIFSNNVLLGLPIAQVTLGEAALPAVSLVLAGWRVSATISAIKLLAQPLAVYALALLLGLSALDTAVVVLLAACPIGANVYLMARQFDVLNGPIASAIVLTTALGALTTPVVLALAGAPVK